MSKAEKITTSGFLVVLVALTMALLVLAPASAPVLLFIWLGSGALMWVMYLLIDWLMSR